MYLGNEDKRVLRIELIVKFKEVLNKEDGLYCATKEEDKIRLIDILTAILSNPSEDVDSRWARTDTKEIVICIVPRDIRVIEIYTINKVQKMFYNWNEEGKESEIWNFISYVMAVYNNWYDRQGNYASINEVVMNELGQKIGDFIGTTTFIGNRIKFNMKYEKLARVECDEGYFSKRIKVTSKNVIEALEL